ncbi:MAG: serine/threonine protein kinase [Bacteroidaceae bacterium]|nr:serine/threonine protein kinase [Bacteroidaceae bacterium]
MMDESSFSDIQHTYPDAELLPIHGSTCDCYRVRLYGKLHFLKRLKPELRTDPRHVAALHKEFVTGYSLEHPHLVRYVSEAEDCLLTEYIDGETLDSFIASHPDYFDNRKNSDRLIRQLLSVVGYLHQHQVVHLDLKPQNILVTRIGQNVKLIDLGYCYTDSYTDTVGRTDKYAAPEQFAANGNEGPNAAASVDARTDIYAVGRILQMLPRANKYNKVIARCTAADPDQRYQSAEQVVAQLERQRQWRYLAVFALLIVAVLSLIWFLPKSQTTTLGSAADTVGLTNQSPLPAEDAHPVKSEVSRELNVDSPTKQSTIDKATDTTENTSPAAAQLPPAEDTLALRREFQQLIGQLFSRELGHYSDSIYYHINLERFSQAWIDFEEDTLFPIWLKVQEKHKTHYSEHTIYTEWCQTVQYYRLTQFWQMMRNDPDHDPFYDGKEFHYYDFPCD